jgi:hypothetical protein
MRGLVWGAVLSWLLVWQPVAAALVLTGVVG